MKFHNKLLVLTKEQELVKLERPLGGFRPKSKNCQLLWKACLGSKQAPAPVYAPWASQFSPMASMRKMWRLEKIVIEADRK